MNYSKSRTKIGVSVDIKSVRETYSITDIPDSITDISDSVILIFKYQWRHQNIWELSTQKIEQNLGKVKTSFSLFLDIIFLFLDTIPFLV